ncbi:MAG TPA: 50S ribosomal protein L29 [Candidatus Limnocylindrales bacterium]|jgi:large subunit ribosomal protein L29
MDIDKVRELTDAELVDELAKQRRHLYDLRFQLATRQLTDHGQLTQARRTIARILTVVTEREMTGVGPVPAKPKVSRATPPAAAKPAPRTRRKAAATAAAEPATAGATRSRKATGDES